MSGGIDPAAQGHTGEAQAGAKQACENRSGEKQSGCGREWPVWLVWLLLAGASMLGFLFAEGMAPARIAAIAAILLAALKVHLVIDHYMELSWRHQPLRLLLAVWLAVVTATILSTYLMT